MPARRRGFDFASFAALVIIGVVVFNAWMRLQPHGRTPRSTPATSGEADEFLARKERWGTKTGADSGAAKIDVAHPTKTTVAELVALPRPADLPEHGGPGSDRFGPVEHTAYTIDAEVVRYKWEEDDDQDDHIVITDYANPGETMIVEIPDPEAVEPSSPWKDLIANAREDVRLDFRTHEPLHQTRRAPSDYGNWLFRFPARPKRSRAERNRTPSSHQG